MNRRPHKVIDESRVGTYHIWSLTSRGNLLTGIDRIRLLDFTYRAEWIQRRVAALAKVFAVECRDREVHPDHFRLLICNRIDRVAEWTDAEVARRYLRLKRTQLDLLPLADESAIDQFLEHADRVTQARLRLSSIAWFMASLKQPIARLANLDDHGFGPFFQANYGCERLPDDAQRLADLAPEWIAPYRRKMKGRPKRRSPPTSDTISIWQARQTTPRPR